MINKRTFIFDTLTEVLNYKIGMDARNETYIIGSFSAQPQRGEPDIPYYSRILIRETNQVWESGQFWLNDVHRDADNDLVTEHAERVAADVLLQEQITISTIIKLFPKKNLLREKLKICRKIRNFNVRLHRLMLSG